MSSHQNILVCLDLAPDCDTVLSRAAAMARDSGARLTVLHIVDHMPPLDLDYGLGGLPGLELDLQSLLDAATARLETLMSAAGLDDTPREIVAGTPNTDIPIQARERGADLIVVGTHDRTGLGRLLGSTAQAVIRHTPCDVLAVHIDTETGA
jgi:universal stress protein A